MYVDDAVVISPEKDWISTKIKSLQTDNVLMDNGNLQNYLMKRESQCTSPK